MPQLSCGGAYIGFTEDYTARTGAKSPNNIECQENDDEHCRLYDTLDLKQMHSNVRASLLRRWRRKSSIDASKKALRKVDIGNFSHRQDSGLDRGRVRMVCDDQFRV